MAAIFPTQEWLDALMDKLNSDEKYAKVAKNWEGDLLFDIQPSGALNDPVYIYLDLWHGKCRGVEMSEKMGEKEAAFVLRAPFDNFVRVLMGDLDPMQAMMTRKLQVKGSMAYMMRNVPTVLDFVRCAKEITKSYLGQEGS
jgi:putative sterol carrier protein